MDNNTTIDTTEVKEKTVNTPGKPVPQSGSGQKEPEKPAKERKERIMPLLEAITTTFHLPAETVPRNQGGPVFNIVGNTIRCRRTKHRTPLISIHMPDPCTESVVVENMEHQIDLCENKLAEDEIRLTELEKRIQQLQQDMATIISEQTHVD